MTWGPGRYARAGPVRRRRSAAAGCRYGGRRRRASRAVAASSRNRGSPAPSRWPSERHYFVVDAGRGERDALGVDVPRYAPGD
jgi:hypothetical protein